MRTQHWNYPINTIGKCICYRTSQWCSFWLLIGTQSSSGRCTDSPLLQKRGNDKDQKDQKKQKKQKDQKKPEEQKQEKPEEQKQEKHVGSKTYYPFNSGQENPVYIKGELDEDFYLNPNFSDDTGEGTTDSPTYDPNQDLGATGGKEDAHTDDDSDQEGSSFADASRGSSSQVLVVSGRNCIV
ncbi:hypothetical protein BASA81_016647 [Batrachochytrium salamandrivorans]|nr:hypothetical protein BASA81_016647 [Batrachochytrium salamandrivorans]